MDLITLLQTDLFKEEAVDIPMPALITPKEKLCYLAGMIDGEGCFGIYKRQDKQGKIVQWLVCLIITNNSVPLMNWLIVSFGGRYFQQDHTQTYHYALRERILRKLVPEVLPYLIVKPDQAKVILQALEIKILEPFSPKLLELSQQIRRLKSFPKSGRPTQRQESFL